MICHEVCMISSSALVLGDSFCSQQTHDRPAGFLVIALAAQQSASAICRGNGLVQLLLAVHDTLNMIGLI